MVQGVVIHESASPQGRGDDAETIHGWHLARGWDGIGYHFVITEDGEVQQGRPIYWSGAHANGYNHYVGICLIGQDGKYMYKQILALQDLLAKLVWTEALDPANIIGHNQISNKSCPGFNVPQFVEGIDFKKYKRRYRE
jgi:hypothetical protein